MSYLKVSLVTESRLEVTKGWQESRVQSYCSLDTEVLLDW
jgi:hypothetical protein